MLVISYYSFCCTGLLILHNPVLIFVSRILKIINLRYNISVYTHMRSTYIPPIANLLHCLRTKQAAIFGSFCCCNS
jgi:hypothetical protein